MIYTLEVQHCEEKSDLGQEKSDLGHFGPAGRFPDYDLVLT